MKITNDKNAGLLDSLIKTQNSKSAKENSTAEKVFNKNSDRVELSSKRRDVDSIKKMAMAVPAVRQDKVDQIRDAIKAETYNIKGELVAKTILKSNILDEIF